MVRLIGSKEMKNFRKCSQACTIARELFCIKGKQRAEDGDIEIYNGEIPHSIFGR